MQEIKTQLLCTFSNKNYLQDDIDGVIEKYFIPNKKIFIFNEEDPDNTDSLFLTYNAEVDKSQNIEHYWKTISIHRKKEYNSFYIYGPHPLH